jgi:FMN phosphatase YigB (HAD superfamily)
MPNRDVRAILFDIGQVIVPVYPRRAAEVLARNARLAADEILAAVRSHPLLAEFQLGRISPERWYEELSQLLGLKISFPEFIAAWNLVLGEQTLLPEEIFERLAAKRRLVLLSNTDAIHVARMEQVFRFPRSFSARLYSCAVGLAKPDPAIYARAIEAAGAAPGEILYIDDVPEFAEAGRRAGLQVHRFRGAEPLLAELRARGLLD